MADEQGIMSLRPVEWMDVATLHRVAALGPEAKAVCDWAIFMEGVLHRIEEFPEHESHYPEHERFDDPRHIAEFALHGNVLSIFGPRIDDRTNTSTNSTDT